MQARHGLRRHPTSFSSGRHKPGLEQNRNAKILRADKCRQFHHENLCDLQRRCRQHLLVPGGAAVSKRNLSRATKRHIFLFCWWLGWVMVGTLMWLVSFLTRWSSELGFFTDDPFTIIIPFLVVQSFFLWWFLKRFFPGYRNWGWVMTMPIIALLSTVFSILYIVGGIMALLGGRG